MHAIFSHHPYWAMFITLWLANNVITTMPTPGSAPGTDSVTYKWLFSALHSSIGSLPRILATLMPDNPLTKMLGIGNGSDASTAPISTKPVDGAPPKA